MRKIQVYVALVFLAASAGFAQNANAGAQQDPNVAPAAGAQNQNQAPAPANDNAPAEDNPPTPNATGRQTQPGVQSSQVQSTESAAQGQEVSRLVIETFDNPGLWEAYIPFDMGTSKVLRRIGQPEFLKSQDQANADQQAQEEARERYVLGVRFNFNKRVWTTLTVKPVIPIWIKGVTEALQVWVVGRGTRHVLSFLVEDILGQQIKLRAEPLTWVGWKQTSVRVPSSVLQNDYRLSSERGLRFHGFALDTDALGVYPAPFYVYFDDLTSTTDIFGVYAQSTDDMTDNW